MKNRREHRGYILIITLGALVLAATVMTALARSAVDHTRAARAAGDELQRRWGVISCRQAILPQAEHILAFREIQAKGSAVSCRAAVRLGKCVFNLTISDEQAKANVNTVLSATDRSTAEDRIRRVLSASGLSTSIRLRPAVENVSTPITGWGQVTDAAVPSRIMAMTSLLTCWGDGRINVSRATAPAIALAAPKLLQTDIRKLVDARNAKPGKATRTDPLGRLFESAGVDIGQSSGVMLGSACHSLWIVTSDGRRVWYDLAVRDDADPDQPHMRCFSW